MASHNAGSRKRPRRRIMRTFKINEISAVDVPAQEGAVAVIMKRRDPQTDEIEKRVFLTTSIEGHAHLVDEQTFDGSFREGGDTSWTQSEGEDFGHSHPWVRSQDGTITIGEADGHSHDVIETKMKIAGKAGKVKKETPVMTKKDEPTVEDLQAQLKRANSISALNDAEKAHFGTLKGDGADAFLAKSADERKVIVEKVVKDKADAEAEEVRKAAEADPVVHTTSEGLEIRKSDGDVVLALAKSNDKLTAVNTKLSGAAENASYEKRAETELKHMPGDVATRAAMLRAVDGIGDEAQRKSAHDSLKAQNEDMGKAFDTVGHGGTPAPGSPDDELDSLAKAYQKDHSDLTYEQAYVAVTKTEAGGELYAKTIN